MTNADLIDDVLFTMGFKHDDAIYHRAAAGMNMGMIMDRLKRQRLEKELMDGGGSRGVTDAMTTYIVPIDQETYLQGRNYFELPSNVYDIRINGGIEYIAYSNTSDCPDGLLGTHFTLSTPGEMDMLMRSTFQKPSPMMPYYFRARLFDGANTYTDRVWLMGPGPTVRNVEVGLYLTMGDLEDLDLNAQVDMPADMVYLVKRAMLDLGRWLLLVPQERLTNDGRDFGVGQQPLQPPKEVSVNDPMNITNAD